VLILTGGLLVLMGVRAQVSPFLIPTCTCGAGARLSASGGGGYMRIPNSSLLAARGIGLPVVLKVSSDDSRCSASSPVVSAVECTCLVSSCKANGSVYRTNGMLLTVCINEVISS
jgi:hypothetical protein